MRISRALVIFTHLIALTGFLAIYLTGAVGPPATAIFSISLTLSFINGRYGKSYYLGHGVSTLLALLLVLYIALGTFFLGVELFQGILDFLIFTQAIKLLSRKRMRDIIQIYILSFFQFLAGTIITVNFSYAIAFIVYIAVAIWAVIVFEMRRGSLEAEGERSGDPELVTPLFLSTTFVVSFCIFLTAALIFISVPRLRGSYFSSGFLRTEELRSGFSDEVKLGRVGEIKLDGSTVMMVRVLDREIDDVPYPVYWRGVALNEFDGITWRAASVGYRVYKPDREGRVIVNDKGSGKDYLEQEIITEPLDTDVLFSANVPMGFGSVPGGRVGGINDSYVLPDRTSYRIKYYAFSDVHEPPPDELREDNPPYADSMEAYLMLPPLGNRVKELALRITSLDADNYDKAISVKRFLLANFRYTRTLEGDSRGYPLEEFLFDKKEGHCEYFATAMAVLLREVGIPSRIVNGFIGGEVNEQGNFFLVRQSDAHSWVEVYFPEHGWVSFDPTPESGNRREAGAFSVIASYVDYLRFRWSRYVIDFSERDQVRLLNSVRDRWSWNNKAFSGVFRLRSVFDKRAAAVIAALVLFTWVFLTKPDIGSLLRKRNAGAGQKASAVYRDALVYLSRRGFPKPESMTAREFSGALAGSSCPGSPVMELLTDKYLRLRFGGSDDEEELRLLAELLKKLKRIKA